MRNPLAKTLVIVGVLVIVASAVGAIAKRRVAHNELERLLSKESPLQAELIVRQKKYEPVEKQADRFQVLIDAEAEITETDDFKKSSTELLEKAKNLQLDMLKTAGDISALRGSIRYARYVNEEETRTCQRYAIAASVLGLVLATVGCALLYTGRGSRGSAELDESPGRSV